MYLPENEDYENYSFYEDIKNILFNYIYNLFNNK